MGPGGRHAAAADFNRDGHVDLAVADYLGDSLVIFLGTGSGRWECRARYPASRPAVVAVGDFDGDGLADVAVANHGSRTLTVFLGLGDGTFRPADSLRCDRPTSLTVVDVNGDRRPDLVAIDARGIQVFLGHGDGTFEADGGTTVRFDGAADPEWPCPAGREAAEGRRLTRREREVAALAAQGFSAREVAAHLGIGRRTVESHLANALPKLGLRSKRHLVLLAADPALRSIPR